MKTRPMTDDARLRAQLADFLDWHNAHAGFDHVVTGIPAKLRGATPKGFAHSIWQIVEHMRIAQHDILDFSTNTHYEEMKWPDDYWPPAAGPKSASAWTKSLASFRADRQSMQRLALNRRFDLLATMITPENPAVLVRDFKTEKTFIITRSDVIRVL